MALANVKDYEDFGKKMLSPPMFTFINGEDYLQDSTDFNSVQLKLRGMANLGKFTDPISHVIGGN